MSKSSVPKHKTANAKLEFIILHVRVIFWFTFLISIMPRWSTFPATWVEVPSRDTQLIKNGCATGHQLQTSTANPASFSTAWSTSPRNSLISCWQRTSYRGEIRPGPKLPVNDHMLTGKEPAYIFLRLLSPPRCETTRTSSAASRRPCFPKMPRGPPQRDRACHHGHTPPDAVPRVRPK